ncbi:MAG: arsenic-transporting ATPase [Candidatus Solincola sediminis]|uniref:arsenite-transporting ATPase n=1 Tax=Candidatus Solincola sediminis TaxID=1797199 RepID=A0A1F2WJ20_9ACTN|nr:MAG: arsenic-transporting ATPase [Candidatus Solincola sediminis]
MRIILFTGKGGVGKTSVASATALRTAELGYPTLVLSTDAAHSLADSFDLDFGHEPVQLTDNLWGQEVSALTEMEENWSIIQSYVEKVFAWGGIEEILVEELMAFPGIDELFSLLEIKKHHDRGEFEVIVVDCAPTGETLRMLSFPDVTRWWMDKLFPLQRKATGIARPLMKAITKFPVTQDMKAVAGLPMPDERIMDSVERFFDRLDKLQKILSDPQQSSVRLVLNPEKMVIKEAQRTYTYLNLFGFSTDAIVANRIIPEEVNDAYFKEWKHIQEKYGKEVEEAFYPLPILKLPLFDREIVGLDMLKRTADKLYGEADPSKLLYKGETQTVVKKGRGYQMSIPLPMVEKKDVELLQKDYELIVKIGNRRRDILLPRALAGMRASGARFEENKLILEFVPGENGEEERHAKRNVAGKK